MHKGRPQKKSADFDPHPLVCICPTPSDVRIHVPIINVAVNEIPPL